MKTISFSYIVVITLLFQANFIIAQEVTIQYLANQGVLITSQNTQILIDATFKMEFDYLDALPNTELTKIENADAPYKSIDIILATHLHGDHFNADIAGNHLSHNRKALFMGPKETIVYFKENFESFQNISSRVESKTPNLFESETVTLKDIKIKVLRLEHFGTTPWNEAENVAYLITLEGKKIIHFGDSKIDIKNLEKFDLINENIDIAIIPYWQLDSSQQKEIIEKYIHPKLILAAHIPLKTYSIAQENIDSLGYENVTVLIKQLKTIAID